MTSVEAYQFGMGLVNQPANGGYPVARFNTFFNAAQIEHMDGLTKDGADMDLMETRSLSPFFVESVVPITSGIGPYNPAGNLAFGPVLWASGYANPTCGQVLAGDPELVPIRLHTASSWSDATRNLIDVITPRNPIARLYGGTTIQVRPLDTRFVFVWYVRYASPIAVGSYIDPDGIERPQEGAPNQVDPEWADADTIEIIWKAMGYTGLTLQSDRLQVTAARKDAK